MHEGQTTWFSPQVDPEHILGRGFEVTRSRAGIQIADPDAGTPPSIVLRSAWGLATRTRRRHYPYDFRPSVFVGPQLWDDRLLRAPPGFLEPSLLPRTIRGRGAYVGPTDEAPSFADVMEFVFVLDSHVEQPPAEVSMAQILLDQRPIGADPFVVVATRVLEPLILSLRQAADHAEVARADDMAEMRTQLDRMDERLRDLQHQPSKLRRALKAGLAAIGAILLGILANRLDPLVEHVDWERLWNLVDSAARQLSLN